MRGNVVPVFEICNKTQHLLPVPHIEEGRHGYDEQEHRYYCDSSRKCHALPGLHASFCKYVEYVNRNRNRKCLLTQ